MTDYWTGTLLTDVVGLVIAGANAYRLQVRWLPVYWIGIVITMAAGDWAAHDHTAGVAPFWFAVSMTGLLIAMLGSVGIPPRWPSARQHRQ
jgi:uncharacterized membrane protein YccC